MVPRSGGRIVRLAVDRAGRSSAAVPPDAARCLPAVRAGLLVPLSVSLLGVGAALMLASVDQRHVISGLAQYEYLQGLELANQGNFSAAAKAPIGPSRSTRTIPRCACSELSFRPAWAASKKRWPIMTTSCKLAPKDLKVLLQAAQLGSLLQNNQTAIKRATAALAVEPASPLAHYLRGAARFKLGQIREALGDLDEAIRLDPKNPMLLAQRGMVHLQQRQTANAIHDFTAASEAERKNPQYHFQRGMANSQGQNWDAAIDDFTKTLGLDPRSPEVYAARADAQNWAGHPAAAADDCTHALELLQGPSDDTAGDRTAVVGLYSLRPRCHLRLNHLDQALADANQALKLDPEWADGYYARGSVELARGETEAARKGSQSGGGAGTRRKQPSRASAHCPQRIESSRGRRGRGHGRSSGGRKAGPASQRAPATRPAPGRRGKLRPADSDVARGARRTLAVRMQP